MKTPIPTPFDIIPPPPGPWVPSSQAWLALLCALLVAWLLIRRVGKRGRSPAVDRIVRNLDAELTHAASQEPVQLERLCRLAKRLIAFYIPHDLTGLTSPETRLIADSLLKGDERARSCAEIVRLLAEIEDHEYEPRRESGDATIRSETEKLAELFSRHIRRHKPL